MAMNAEASAGHQSAPVVSSESEGAVRSEGHGQGSKGSNLRVILLCIFIANTGFFHGYDNGVISDVLTMPSFRAMVGWPEREDLEVAFQEGLIVNGFNVGAAVSAVVAGHLLVDRYGRRPALILGSVLFAVGGLVQCTAQVTVMLVVGRVIAGVGVGITSSAGPAYISEVSPPHLRGAMVGVYQSNVCVAIAVASILNYCVHSMEGGWRITLGIQVLLGVFTAAGLFFCSETPRFLQVSGATERALEVLTKLRGGDEALARQELEAVQAEIDGERQAGSATWAELFRTPFFRNVVVLGCFMQFFQIITGINAMVSFGGTLFQTMGVRGLASTVAPSLFFTLGNTIGSFVLVDRLGRRPLLVWGMVAMALTMIVGGVVAMTTMEVGAEGEETMPRVAGYVVVAMVVAYMFSFGMSWGFGTWLYTSEIMPLRVRGKAVGLCTATNWGPANIISAFITPVMIAGPMGPGGTLLFFGLVCAAVVPFALLVVPETKGRSLEEITPMFRFASCVDFRRFMRGNLADGTGMGVGGAPVKSAQKLSSDADDTTASNVSSCTRDSFSTSSIGE